MKKTAIMSLALTFVLPLLCHAADWRDARDELLAEIEESVQKEVKEKASRELIAVTHNVDLPIPAPEKSLLDVCREVKDEVNRLGEEEFSAEKNEAFISKIASSNTLIKVGDEVSFNSAIKKGEVIKGKVTAMNKDMIKIGYRWLSVADLPKDIQERLNEETCKKRLARELDLGKRKYAMLKTDFYQEKFAELLPAYMDKYGYCCTVTDPARADLLEASNWLSKQEYFEKIVQARQAVIEKEARERLLAPTMTDSGYIFDTKKNEWIPKQLYVQPEETSTKETQEPEKKGFFQKLKSIFS